MFSFKNITKKIYHIANKLTSQAEDRDQQQAQVLHLSKLKTSHLEKAYGAEVLESAQISICPFNMIKNSVYKEITMPMQLQITNTSPAIE